MTNCFCEAGGVQVGPEKVGVVGTSIEQGKFMSAAAHVAQ